MILRDYLTLILSIGLSLSGFLNLVEGERWSRQVSNSEWIPLAHPRSQHPQSLAAVAAVNSAPQQHQSIQGLNLPPALRQEYQQQLHQLQKTQESIQKLLLLQQQLRSQQQLLQNQAYLPDEEKQQQQPFRQQTSISNVRTHQELTQEAALPPPQLSSEALPSVYSHQDFKQSHENHPEAPSGPSGTEEKPENNSDEEIQVVYVPAETLAQRGQSKEERNRDHKHFSFPPQRQQSQRYQQQQQQQQQDNIGEPVNQSDEDVSYSSELVQFPRGQEATDQFFKEARQKELDRLNEEHKQIQKQAKIQAAARQREQERARQRDAERKLKELAKIEELARQRELDRLREVRERQRLDAIKRDKERAAKLKEEQARQAEIDRLAALERQKNAEIERSLARQKELEKFARQEEEERAKELAARKELETTDLPAAEHLINQQHQQHHTETGKHHHKRPRNKPRYRLPHHHHHKTSEEQLERSQETSTTPPTPNQPPLAVFMGSSDLDAEEVKIVDVLRVLRDAKTIAVLDQVASDAPKIFVGPAILEPPRNYAKFELPYLSSLDTNRVERRVDKLPFFVAPLSFRPPLGYSKIPFPAPHIGSVIVNTAESNIGPTGGSQNVHKPSLRPFIEPNSFIASSGEGSTYQASYEAPSGPSYSTYPQDYVTPQYQSSVYPSTSSERFRYRQQQQQQQQYEQPGAHNLANQESASISPYQEEVTAAPRPHHSPPYQEQSYLGQVTPESYRRPTVVSSYSYSQDPVSTTPVYQDSYSHTRVQPNKDQEITSQLAQINQHDYSQHRHSENSYQHPSLQGNTNPHHQQYHLSSAAPNSYEETSYQGPVGPTQYSLPAELPPIHPQLPGLVNSLLEEKEADKIVTTTTTTTTTTTPAPTTTTTTTETPTTTYRSRIRQRGRIASRPTTTSTTTSSPPTSRGHIERTRRPFNRSRSRYTTTTEEYRETSYEPTKAKVPDTTQRYSSQEHYRRPIALKIPKFKNRERTNYESTTLNQITNIQSHETLSDEGSPPEDSNSRQTSYSQYNAPLSTASPPNAYLNQESVENPSNAFSSEIDYSKTPNYPRPSGPLRDERIQSSSNEQQDQYHERYPAAASAYQPNVERPAVNGFDYEIRDETAGSTLAASPAPGDYSYYQDKTESVEATGGQAATEAPIYSQILEYRPGTRPEGAQQGHGINNGDFNHPGSFDNNDDKSSGSFEDKQAYNQYSSEVPQRHHQSEAYSEREVDLTTEPIMTTTTDSPPMVIRQRVRGRLGGRPRPESAVQTHARGPQDEYVRFSAVNQGSSPGSRVSSSTAGRPRDSARPRPKARPNHYHQAQVQSEGNEYVRIQSANRPSYPKTIVQAAVPTTARTTTTTLAPITTTEETPQHDDIEYGFIRPPNFNQPHHHQLSSKFRAPESQIQLQNVAPTDETAEDSSPTHTQIPKHRQKYQSPNRPRPTIKSSSYPVTTTPSSVDTSSYTTKPRVRADEPKNRIRTKGRRPGRRRTTTTSTTTEYTLEGNNNLPPEENYPRIPIQSTEGALDRQSIYDTGYETLPPSPEASAGSPSRADYVEENYPPQDFALNFGGNPDAEEQQDQSNGGQHLPYKHQGHRHESSGRLRPYESHAAAPERDIYGSESQWSTKLTKSSFQPVNQLNQEDKYHSSERESQESKEDVPEIITAQPEDAFVTVMVSSADRGNETKSEGLSGEDPVESMDFGEKMITPETTQNSTEGNSAPQIPQRRRIGVRRRRVRVRMRPSPPDDFVTAESQHFNSAVNNLVQDRVKYSSLDSSSRFMSKAPESPDQTLSSATVDSSGVTSSDESIVPSETTTISYTEIPSEQSEASTVPPTIDEASTEVKSQSEELITTTTTEASSTEFETTSNDSTTISTPIMTTMTIPRKSWDSTKAYTDWFVKKMDKPFSFREDVLNKSSKDEETNDSVTKSSEESDESHPKNHRSEWSEVRYPSDRSVFGYGRSEKLSPTTQLPGIVTKSVGDTSVKTLSDYVQAIFDTMKNADEERAIVDNAPNLWSDETKPTSTEAYDIPALSTIMDLGKASSVSPSPSEDEEMHKESSEKSIETTTKVAEVTEALTETSKDDDEDGVTTMKFPTISESLTSVPSILTTLEALTTVSEQTPSSPKNVTSKLGAILRTSTTTKVSHMTEICYRGRCVMTKPRKDFHER